MTANELIIAISNTLMVLGLTLVIAMPVGVFLALTLFRTDVYGRRFLWVALGSQIAVPLYVFAGGWSAGFGFQGWITSAGFRFSDFVGNSEAGSWGALLATASIHSLAAIPWVALFLSIGLLWVHRGEEEQALLDGGLANVFLRSILPKSRLWLAAGAMSCIVPIMTEMVVSNLYQLPTTAEQVYLDVSLGEVSPLTYVSGFFFCMLPIAIGLMILLARSKSLPELQHKERHFAASPFGLGRWRLPLSCVVWALILFLVGLPIASLVAKAGWTPLAEDGRTTYGWSLARFGTTAQESLLLFGPEFYWSSLLAFGSSSIALATSCFAYTLVPTKRRWIPSVGCLLLLSVPGPLVGILTIWLLNRSEPTWVGQLYDSTLAAPILAQQFRILPFAWMLTCITIASISRRSWEQSELDGLTGLTKLRQIVLPQTKYRWLASLLLLFVMSFGEISCSILVLPPAVSTVSMTLFQFLHFGMRHQDSGLCCILMILGWTVSYAFWKTLSER